MPALDKTVLVIQVIVVISFANLVQASGSYVLSDIPLGGSVQVIQEDLHAPGNLILNAGYALLTFDGTRSHLIAGMAHESGYVEAVRESARFRSIMGILHHTKHKTLIVDSSNHCLRAVDRRTNRTHEYLGNCTNGGYSYGDKPLFYNPYGLIRDSKKSQIIYTLVYKRLIRINTTAMTSNVVIESDLLQYYANLVQEPKSGDIYITTRLGVVKFDYTGYFLTLISGRSDFDYDILHNDGPLQDALYYWLKGIIVLDNSILVVADRNNHRLRVLDLMSDSTWSICSGQIGENEGDFDSCQLEYPFGIFADCETIYIGLENRRIGLIRITDIMSLTSQANSSNSPCTATEIQFAPTRNADLLTTETAPTETAPTEKAVTLAAVVPSGAMKCYVCTNLDSTCNDEYTGVTDHETYCRVNDGGCNKYKKETIIHGIKAITVSRTCGQSYATFTYCKQEDRLRTDTGTTWACSCEGALCNGGSQLAFSSALLIAALAKYLLKLSIRSDF